MMGEFTEDWVVILTLNSNWGNYIRDIGGFTSEQLAVSAGEKWLKHTNSECSFFVAARRK